MALTKQTARRSTGGTRPPLRTAFEEPLKPATKPITKKVEKSSKPKLKQQIKRHTKATPTWMREMMGSDTSSEETEA